MINIDVIHFIWDALAHKNKTTVIDTVVYAIHRGMNASEDYNQKVLISQSILMKCFSPVTKKIKLYNGRRTFDAIEHALEKINQELTILLMISKKNEEIESRECKLLTFSNKDDLLARKVVENLYRNFTDDDTDYMYFFVRTDIDPIHQLVQVAHVAMKIGYRNAVDYCIDMKPDNTNFVVCGVNDEKELGDIMHRGFPNAYFIEPDMNNTMTAVAIGPVKNIDRHHFANYNLLQLPVNLTAWG